jgi:hypothetical protein
MMEEALVGVPLGHDELIDGVAAISAKAVTIKPERDRLIHCNLSEDLVIRIRRGEVVEILEIGSAPQIEDLGHISNITVELFHHFGRLARFFDNPL